MNKEAEKELIEELLRLSNISAIKMQAKFFCSDTMLKSEEYVSNLVKAMLDKEKMMAYFDSFSDEGKRIFLEIIFNSGIRLSEVEKRLSIAKNDFGEFKKSDIDKIPFLFFNRIEYYADNFLTIPTVLRRILKKDFEEFYSEKKFINGEEFEKSKNLFSKADGEEFFFNLTSIISILKDLDFFSRPVGSPVPKGTLNKIFRLCQFKTFYNGMPLSKANDEEYKKNGCLYTERECDKLKNARINLALAFLSLAYKEKNDELLLNVNELYRTLLHNFVITEDTTIDEKFIYPFVSVTANYYSFDSRVKVFHSIVEKIKKNPPKEPTFFSYYRQQFDEDDVYPFFDSRTSSVYMKLHAYEKQFSSEQFHTQDRVYITESIYWRYVFESAFNNLFLLFASIGLFEITWKEPTDFSCVDKSNMCDKLNEKDFYPFGRIEAIRITPLGEYAFHISDTFFISGMKSFKAPVFDEKELVVHIDAADKANQLFLDKFCTPLSRSLFKTDMAKLRKNFSSAMEIKNLFQALENKAGKPLAANWQRLEKEVENSFIKIECETDWIVINLDKKNDSFIRCVDKIAWQGLCTKMGGLRIAVKKSELTHFFKAVENNGFKIETDLK